MVKLLLSLFENNIAQKFSNATRAGLRGKERIAGKRFSGVASAGHHFSDVDDSGKLDDVGGFPGILIEGYADAVDPDLTVFDHRKPGRHAAAELPGRGCCIRRRTFRCR